MSFLRRLFGTVTPEELQREADEAFERRAFPDARAAYSKLVDRRDVTAEARARYQARIAETYDKQAEVHIEQAMRLADDGERGLADQELETALEVARSPLVKARALKERDRADRRAARREATSAPLTDDQRYVRIAGNWEAPQLEEYDRYGERFRRATIALDREQVGEARAELEALASEFPRGVYLFLELARARARMGRVSASSNGGSAVDGDLELAAEALRTFLSRVPDDDRSQARVLAYVFLAQIADAGRDETKAIEELQAGIDAMPDDPRPFLQLGAYLRDKGHGEEAVEVIESALALSEEQQDGNWPVLHELALAKRLVGRRDEAIELLERVVRIFVARSSLDFPPAVAVPLAELQEEAGNLARAADLYAGLTRGSHREEHGRYYREAGRLLTKLGLKQEARRMWTRASALVEGAPELEASIELALSELDDE